MGIAALNPLYDDDANERAIVETLSHLADALTGSCLRLQADDSATATGRLDRYREAIDHIASAAKVLGESGRPALDGDHMRPFCEAPPHRLGPSSERRFAPLVGDGRLPPGRYHP